MLVVVEQALGDVECSDFVVPRLFSEGGDKFVVGAARWIGGLVADSVGVVRKPR